MIRTLRGRLAALEPEGAVVEVGGVGLLARVSATTATRLPAPGEPVSLLTYLVVREEALDLYGFVDAAERDLFEAFISVSGVGPRLALAICGISRPEELRLALARGDARTLQSAPGVGKRTAERVVLELKDRLGSIAAGDAEGSAASPAAAVIAAREGLMGLGFSAEEADEALSGAPVEADSEELVRHGLDALRRR
jgi:Holliday junction DNA helicase RuvA